MFRSVLQQLSLILFADAPRNVNVTVHVHVSTKNDRIGPTEVNMIFCSNDSDNIFFFGKYKGNYSITNQWNNKTRCSLWALQLWVSGVCLCFMIYLVMICVNDRKCCILLTALNFTFIITLTIYMKSHKNLSHKMSIMLVGSATITSFMV